MRSETVGLIAGVFDLVHAGHVLALKDARKYCDRLIVALHVAPENPTKNQPIMSVDERETILRGCRYVDDVAIYRTEDELCSLLATHDFDIRFIGEDYRTLPIVGSWLTPSIQFLSRDHGWSSRELRARVYAAERAKEAA